MTSLSIFPSCSAAPALSRSRHDSTSPARDRGGPSLKTLAAFVLVLTHTIPSRALEFPGAEPGKVRTQVKDNRLTIGNHALSATWSLANAEVLVDTHWIGGDPAKLEEYGYASWSPRKGLVMLRNPDDQPREFALDLGAVFELPGGAVKKFSLRSPWPEDTTKPALSAETGKPLRVTLHPFEVLILAARSQN